MKVPDINSKASENDPTGQRADQQSGARAQRPVSEFLTYRIARLHLALNAQATSILEATAHISLGQWRVIVMIGGGEASTSREVSARSGLDPAFVSRVSASLDAEGLITTRRSTADRRILDLSLTPLGAEIYERLQPIMQARQDALLAALDETEREAIFTIIDKLDIAAEARAFEAPADDA